MEDLHFCKFANMLRNDIRHNRERRISAWIDIVPSVLPCVHPIPTWSDAHT